MSDKPIELTLEQQFSLRSFQNSVERMSREQAQEFLVKMYHHMMLRETMYRHFLKLQWGVETSRFDDFKPDDKDGNGGDTP